MTIIVTIRDIAKPLGWAIGVHGSLARDIDLIGVPWTGEACNAEALVSAIADGTGYAAVGELGNPRPGGRRSVLLKHPNAIRLDPPNAKGHWDPMVVDLSLMPSDKAEVEALHRTVIRQGKILTRAANALRGMPPANVTWSHHDVGEFAELVVAFLKEAKDDAERAKAYRNGMHVRNYKEMREAQQRLEQATSLLVKARQWVVQCVGITAAATAYDIDTFLEARLAKPKRMVEADLVRHAVDALTREWRIPQCWVDGSPEATAVRELVAAIGETEG